MIILMAWATENLQQEPQVRTMLFASGTVLAYVMSAFIPIAAFPAVDAPNWKIGSKLYLGFTITAALVFFAIHYRLKWEAGRKANNGVVIEIAHMPNNDGVRDFGHGDKASAVPERQSL
jgi:uncharacterized membrane protein